MHGLDSFPPGGALVVANHSGGMFPMDVPVFSVDFYDKFGYDRPVYTLSHDILFMGLTGDLFRRTGYIRATRENAAKALRSGGVVVVFPGGDYDAYRPTFAENVIDFNGRKGYVSTAVEAGVPIVPAVSIGGQESQLYLSRGTWLARRLGLKRLLRSDILPISFGFPFGFSAAIPPNLPLPAKIVMQVLDPINLTKQFGEDPDVDAVDEHGTVGDAASPQRPRRQAPLPDSGLSHAYQTSIRLDRHHAPGRVDRSAATRPLPADRRRHAPRRHGVYGGVRRCGPTLPGPPRPDRRTGHADLAPARRTRQRAGRGASGPASRTPQGRRHHVPQSSRLRRCAVGGQPDWRAHPVAQHLLRRSGTGRGGYPRRRRHCRL
ncbi:hypothetical protein MRGA327_08930 [Mycobacterium tuberculosis RGTB327]|nr:hypothetical protein MRGA327_08930 [Mycobacterium tuberculosis RGTB327]